MDNIIKHCLKRKDTSKEANQCKTLNQIMFDAGYNTAIDDLEKLSIQPKVMVEIGEVKKWTT